MLMLSMNASQAIQVYKSIGAHGEVKYSQHALAQFHAHLDIDAYHLHPSHRYVRQRLDSLNCYVAIGSSNILTFDSSK